MGLYSPLVYTAYFTSISIIMRISRLIHFDVSNDMPLRYDCLWFSLGLATTLTIVSSHFEKHIEQHIAWFI